jgi:hypothetical protein
VGSAAFEDFADHRLAFTAPERGTAVHIKQAYTTPGATKPPNDNMKIPGQKPDAPLHRL